MKPREYVWCERERDSGRRGGGVGKSASFEQTCEQKPAQTVGPEAWGVYGFCIYNQQIKGFPPLRHPPQPPLFIGNGKLSPSIWGVSTNYERKLSGQIRPCREGRAYELPFIRGKKTGQ